MTSFTPGCSCFSSTRSWTELDRSGDLDGYLDRFGPHDAAHLLSDKLVHVLILRQEVVPVEPSTDPHGPNLFWSLREQKVVSMASKIRYS